MLLQDSLRTRKLERPNDSFFLHCSETVNEANSIRTKRTTDDTSGRDFLITRMLGGKDTVHGDWPWLVAVYFVEPTGINFQCGGSLVNNRTVLTAAHCVRINGIDRRPAELHLWLGRHTLINLYEEGAVPSSVERIYIHPDYKPSAENQLFDADIAILIMSQPVTYTKYIRPISMWLEAAPLGAQDIEGMYGTVVGWGINSSGNISDTPLKIVIPVVSALTCEQTINNNNLKALRTFCAGSLNKELPCTGDSG